MNSLVLTFCHDNCFLYVHRALLLSLTGLVGSVFSLLSIHKPAPTKWYKRCTFVAYASHSLWRAGVSDDKIFFIQKSHQL